MQEDKNAIFQMRFPHKLWYLLNMRTDAILWGGSGRTILLNYRILHSYLQCDNSIFKTTNISSFVRQLNLYGFRKVTSHLQDPLCNSSNPYMHEYIHDFFQYGRPELLNKITRKALTLKRNSKPKNIFNCTEQSAFITPLQKARRALRIALKKAAQELFMQSSPKQFNVTNEFEDVQDDFGDDDSISGDWLIPNSENNDMQKEQSLPVLSAEKPQENNYIHTGDGFQNFGDKSQDTLMGFSDDSCQQNVDNFPGQFLNMPDLDPVPSESSGVELLAEFNIGDENRHDIATKMVSKPIDHQFLNCVLPSISNDQNDDVTMSERHDENMTHYHSEWDQMFNDIIINKSSAPESSSNLKELYTQISQTIHL
ncbi:PREDICTED: heat shock transcription factor-like isoform X1 [Papilio xuthus]|uniref:Heat shock transcription factor-like isoform X1 n=1 Tax=Papilio xuthus TaxID=66420 RepID=A0AAJ6ZAU6_PAPXU|nr:PREDICTED: heat shock transcription factor-like isoform X1 [Papilio xuthus]